jgi:predicted kinase
MLILIRGLPGSGKSTLAKNLQASIGGVHLESDQYFAYAGTYMFDPTKLVDAHKWCQDWADISLRARQTTIVSNTFTQMWEMKPYLELAKEYNVRVQVIHVESNFGSVHNVPEATIQKMRTRWEPFNNE